MAEIKRYSVSVVGVDEALSTSDKKSDIVLMETEVEGAYRVIQSSHDKLKIQQPPKPKRKVESVKM